MESDWAALPLRIETAAFLHDGELTGRAAGARSNRDGRRKPLGIETSALRQFARHRMYVRAAAEFEPGTHDAG